MWPVWRTMARIRRPPRSVDHTVMPDRAFCTGTGPFGVAISVPRARQIGHIGARPCVLDRIRTVPVRETVPVSEALLLGYRFEGTTTWKRSPFPEGTRSIA